MNMNSLPVVVIGAGPVGLAAAAHLHARRMPVLVLEAGASVGAGMLQWAQVRMFSPWQFNIDREARILLAAQGWEGPNPDTFPTGAEVVQHYLRPLAATPALSGTIRLNSRVLAVSRVQHDLMKNAERDTSPFLIRYQNADGEHEILAQAVIDASGTVEQPNPLGAAGLLALGERALQAEIAYGMPDVLGEQRTRYAGKRVLVVGSGHSAFNVLNDLAVLAADAPKMQIHWAIRRSDLRRVLGGGEHDQLQERGRLGLKIKQLLDRGVLVLHPGFHLQRLARTDQGIVAFSNHQALPAVDEIIGCTGFRPNLSLLSELRLDLDPGTQSPRALAPLIDPNLHSCGSVRPHGAEELKHPDAGVYVVGMKSYGRAPTFLLLTGYEQVRSVVAAIAGDWESARRVELVLPETGVCITQFEDETPVASACCVPKSEAGLTLAETSDSACCGGAPKQDASACCVKDEQAKAQGQSGCGCGPAVTNIALPPVHKSSCCT
ncbi:flavoprotein [Ahniella affigens]|uniref:Flavoprotein n=1 Tax=Ahniella affigens TaxID=2021234 RepID=A0A2P1PN48_9GAMM|nr:NAD(P)-binding domain-containing protein [Ahniella affigens]AVP96247.1 flavoprotein [Ahniella affigens]